MFLFQIAFSQGQAGKAVEFDSKVHLNSDLQQHIQSTLVNSASSDLTQMGIIAPKDKVDEFGNRVQAILGNANGRQASDVAKDLELARQQFTQETLSFAITMKQVNEKQLRDYLEKQGMDQTTVAQITTGIASGNLSQTDAGRIASLDVYKDELYRKNNEEFLAGKIDEKKYSSHNDYIANASSLEELRNFSNTWWGKNSWASIAKAADTEISTVATLIKQNLDSFARIVPPVIRAQNTALQRFEALLEQALVAAIVAESYAAYALGKKEAEKEKEKGTKEKDETEIKSSIYVAEVAAEREGDLTSIINKLRAYPDFTSLPRDAQETIVAGLTTHFDQCVEIGKKEYTQEHVPAGFAGFKPLA